MDVFHDRFHLMHLENRRKIFMLKIMYKLSLNKEYVDLYRPERILRT